MNEGQTLSWRKYALLLGALAAGTTVTQLMPPYEPFLGKITYPTHSSQSASTAEAGDNTNDYSATEAPENHLLLVRGMK